jgi:hypothetical protein
MRKLDFAQRWSEDAKSAEWVNQRQYCVWLFWKWSCAQSANSSVYNLIEEYCTSKGGSENVKQATATISWYSDKQSM